MEPTNGEAIRRIMTDELDKAFARTDTSVGDVKRYVCRKCGRVFEDGRKGRTHLAEDHDSHLGLKAVRE